MNFLKPKIFPPKESFFKNSLSIGIALKSNSQMDNNMMPKLYKEGFPCVPTGSVYASLLSNDQIISALGHWNGQRTRNDQTHENRKTKQNKTNSNNNNKTMLKSFLDDMFDVIMQYYEEYSLWLRVRLHFFHADFPTLKNIEKKKYIYGPWT